MDFSFASSLFSFGFAATIIALWIGIKLSHKFDFLDQPGGRKDHAEATPLIGGLVIIPIYFILGSILHLDYTMPFTYLIWGVMLLLSVGAIDDKVHIHPWVRFVIQIWVACYIVIFCAAEIEMMGDLFGFGNINMGYIAKPFSVICLVLLMNAINMMDGVDGLASGFVLIALSWLLFVAYDAGIMSQFWGIALLIAPILAFLCYNMRHPLRKKASIFLGDAGSLSLALILGWFAINLSQYPGNMNVLAPVSIIWIMAVPIIDTFALFFVRMKQGRSPFEADRLHLHHKILDKGYTPTQTTLIILGIALTSGAIGVYGIKLGVPESILLYSWSSIWIGYTYYRLKHA